ncbi:hypothetical protein [Flavobacterium sp.]|uniref:hypothetical protein n=1 Tax=Flavobacterium sp. TaxID=239 RepID=UPI0025C315B0|nr:hypothetical protein [Flavobacterium sp.]
MKNISIKSLIFLIVIGGLTLPFHWVPSEKMVIPKKKLSFSRTFVTEDDVKEIVEKYYLGSPKEKFEIEGDPLTDAIKDKWNVYTNGNNTIYQHLK